MKMLKTIGIVLGSLIVIVLVASFLVTTEANFEASVTIDAPIEVVWENVNSHADLDRWSPWNERDPDMQVVNPEQDGIVGAKKSWDSENPDVGKGSQTITKLEAPTLIETDLKFYTPYESEAVAFVKLAAEDSTTTTVTWGFNSEMPRPFNLMSLAMSMEDMIGSDYREGLKRLKKLSE